MVHEWMAGNARKKSWIVLRIKVIEKEWYSTRNLNRVVHWKTAIIITIILLLRDRGTERLYTLIKVSAKLVAGW